MREKLSVLTMKDKIVEFVLHERKPAENLEMLKMPLPTMLWRGKDAHLSQGAANESKRKSREGNPLVRSIQQLSAGQNSASTLLQPDILGGVILPLVLASQAGPLPNPSCPLCWMHTRLLFIHQRGDHFSEGLDYGPVCCRFHKDDCARLHLVGAYEYLKGRKRVKIKTMEFEFMGTH